MSDGKKEVEAGKQLTKDIMDAEFENRKDLLWEITQEAHDLMMDRINDTDSVTNIELFLLSYAAKSLSDRLLKQAKGVGMVEDNGED